MRRTISRLSAVNWSTKTNSEIADAVKNKQIPFYAIEEALKPDYERAIEVRVRW